jgi:outer membrane receptor for ferrienterochelin and colicins
MRSARRTGRAVLEAAAALVLGAAAAAAQGPAELRGRVVDAVTGAPIAGAAVVLAGADGAAATSGADGRWAIAGLPGGELVAAVRKAGFVARTVRVRVPATAELVVALAPEALKLDALVVTASRRVQRLADAPVTTELITREEIEQTGASDLASALVERTGIQLEGGQPAGAGVMLEGFGSERVLVLLDGQPLVGRISGQFDLSRIPASIVQRVEVVKGPQSSLYGSEAMGGVVNIITRKPERGVWGAGADVTAGTQGRADVDANLRGSAGPIAYTVQGGRRTTQLTPGQAAETGALSERWDGSTRLTWSPRPSLQLGASGLLLSERQRWQSGPIYIFADNVQRSARLEAAWTAPASRLGATLYLTDFDHLSRQALAPQPVDGSGDHEIQRLVEGELLYNYARGDGALDLGVEAKRETTASDRVEGHNRTLHSLEPFAQATWTVGNASIVPGMRFAWSEQWGTHWTPRLAALYRPVPALGLRASVGRGYRAPAFKELYLEFLNTGAGFSYTVRGNPDLTPESSTNFTGSAEWAEGPIYLRAQGFYNRFDDFIETRLVGDSSGVSVYTYGNIARGFTRGVELEGGFVHGGFRAEAGYSHTGARDTEADQPLLGLSPNTARLALENPLWLGVRGALTGLYTGTTPVTLTEAGAVADRDGFFRLDLRLARPIREGVQLTAGVKNLFDTDPGEWPGFAGRHLYLGLSWNAAGTRAGSAFPSID